MTHGSVDRRAYAALDRVLRPTRFRRYGRLLCSPDPALPSPPVHPFFGPAFKLPTRLPPGWVVTGHVLGHGCIVAVTVVKQGVAGCTRDRRMADFVVGTDELLLVLAAARVPVVYEEWNLVSPMHSMVCAGDVDLVIRNLSNPHARVPMEIGPVLTRVLEGGQVSMRDPELTVESITAWSSVSGVWAPTSSNVVCKEFEAFEAAVLLDAAHGEVGAHDMTDYNPRAVTPGILLRVNNYRRRHRHRFGCHVDD